MKVIGLTGGSGSGKSLVCRYLNDNGAYIVDADAIAHEIIKKGNAAYNEIVGHFGCSILDEHKNIVRRALGSIVFTNTDELLYLNQCTHRHIYAQISKEITEAKKLTYNLIIIDAPLFDDTLAAFCDEVWAVYADEQTRTKRIMDRDGITFEQAQDRIKSQASFNSYKKYADYILENTKDKDYLIEQVSKFIKD